MKKRYALYAILAVLLANMPLYAQTALTPATPQTQNYVIVNGQKFFLMQNARRYNGTGGLSPQALGVVNHPRSPGVVVHKSAAPVPVFNGDPPSSKSSSSGTSSTPTPSQNPVLSVFAPNENR